MEQTVVSVNAINRTSTAQKMKNYSRHPGSLLVFILTVLAAVVTVGALAALIIWVLIKGIPNLTPDMFSLTYTTDNQSMLPAMLNTVQMVLVALVIAVPFGIGSAIYLVEYAKKGNRLVTIIRLTTETLSGIPSIIYGLFGYLCFNVAIKMGYSILSGGLTLAIMILPLVMRTTEEALLAVPDSYREGSYGLGAGKCRTIFKLVLPSAVPGILSGVILSIGRIVGETAALIFTAGTVGDIATSLTSSGRTLAVHMYLLANEGLYINKAYAVAVVLLVLVLLLNGVSGLIAGKLKKG
ncbi:MAG TPA: phosphate ABC transporter permease PstA [Candidatus Faecivivens stercoripullorum]|uniref:Phosphate transport system permease protein PstA n=1 Tax=Candidatus Faecivivens stercoripullorum TaxID=2840805 RepID=A0A9D1KQK2_9FIRM|nr:phosphate ABC transporter permease PstA [Candidatus Faecivivens stercoripullorum]